MAPNISKMQESPTRKYKSILQIRILLALEYHTFYKMTPDYGISPIRRAPSHLQSVCVIVIAFRPQLCVTFAHIGYREAVAMRRKVFNQATSKRLLGQAIAQ